MTESTEHRVIANVPVLVVLADVPMPQPVSFGVPLPKGSAQQGCLEGWLEASDGSCCSAQVAPLSQWSDGSLKWVRVDSVICDSSHDLTWRIVLTEPEPGKHGSLAEELPHSKLIQCGPVLISIGSTRLSQSTRGDISLGPENWILIDRRGQENHPEFARPVTGLQGPVCVTIEQSGVFRKLQGLRVLVRWTIYGECGLVRCDATLHNSRRARHRGGMWDLGDPGSYLFEDFSFRIGLPNSAHSGRTRPTISAVLEPGGKCRAADRLLSVYQDSSGGENWQSYCHVNRNGKIPCRFPDYRATFDGKTESGLRAAPQVSLATDDRSLSLAVPEFWQQFPKAITATAKEIRLGLFPKEWEDLHELQGGERKRHTFWLKFSKPGKDVGDLAWVHHPAIVSANAESCIESSVLSEIRPTTSAAFDHFRIVTNEGVFGDKGLLINRERFDEYGWRNFGELVADHESVYYQGDAPFISHYNNQFDVLLGFLLQFLRTGERLWFRLADELARHVMDIDIYHTVDDKAAHNGGLFWFTDHYLTAHTATHRTYSRHNAPASGTYGGGPGSEHNFSEGLLLYHFLTACPDARDAVVGLADWVVRMEDGRLNVLGIVDDGPTGKATAGQAKPGRGGGNSISVLVDAWTLTRDAKYVTLCEGLIHRCVHPEDDIPALDLLNAERNWSYTIFLSSLSKYLAAKEEAGLLDACYWYARESLSHYAKWMLAHERPYFEQVDRLEYPTEAWAAQELRKANVFRRAARYADPILAERLLAKGDEFGDRAWMDLMRFEVTRMTIRSLALVMTEGLADCVFRHNRDNASMAAGWMESFPARRQFTDQKRRVFALSKSPMGVVKLMARIASPQRWRRIQQMRSSGK